MYSLKLNNLPFCTLTFNRESKKISERIRERKYWDERFKRTIRDPPKQYKVTKGEKER